MKLLANKVHMQGMKVYDCMADKVHKQESLNGYIYLTQSFLHK